MREFLDFRSDKAGPDEITPEERAAIDAFPEDKIQKVPTGKRALDFQFAWDGNRLKSVNAEGKPMTREETLAKLKSFGKAAPYRRPAKMWQDTVAAENRQKVQEAVEAGARTNREIQKATGLAESTVSNWLRHLQIDLKAMREAEE